MNNHGVHAEKHWRELRDFVLPYAPERENDAKLTQFVRGKRVVLVGPAPYMDEKALGKRIDGYDVVVRLSTGACLPKKCPENFGTRTDVVYASAAFRRHFRRKLPDTFAMPRFYVDMNQLVTEKLPEKENKCGVCGKAIDVGEVIDLNLIPEDALKEKPRHSRCHRLCHPDNGRYAALFDPAKTCIVKTFTNQYYGFIDRLVKVNLFSDESARAALIGMHALIDLLRRQPAELQIHGFDFYADLPRKKILTAKIGEKRDFAIEKQTIYSKSYDVVEGSLTACHKDVDRTQLRLFREIKNNYFHAFPNTMLRIDEHLQTVITHSVAHELREKLAQARHGRRSKAGLGVRS